MPPAKFPLRGSLGYGLAKLFCEGISPGSLAGIKSPSIKDWRDVILKKTVHFPRTRISVAGRYPVVPWASWANGAKPKNPDWWKAYNKVKHNRSDHFREANQENVVHALCGLTVLCLAAFPFSLGTWRQNYFRLTGMA
jgi:hypothetical protein